MSYTRIVPLGGLGEVGMNCLALESPDGIVVIDCGVTFPHDNLGIEVLYPDLAYLWERRDDVLGVVVTHGHEDHIGALPYLLKRIPVPVYAPPYAAALIHNRLAEHKDVPPVALHHTVPRARFNLGPYQIEPLRVTHSIPDATALCIDTPAGRIFHSGDFKLEQDPLDGEASDETRFRELGEEGVAVLLSDSTNVDVPGRAGRERDVAAKLTEIVGRTEGRVVVGVFASNIFRLQTLANAAAATGRRLCLLGRSVQTHARAATDLGRLRVRSDLYVHPDAAMDLPARELLVVATGTQAEPASALSRLSRGEHPQLKLGRGDAVILSSRTIPGNERTVFDVVCALERLGVDVHFRGREGELHVSGHAAREEQSRMIDLLRPRAFVPIHGTYHHLRRHAELAGSLGVPDVTIIENGQTARWAQGTLRRDEGVPHGRIAVEDRVDLPPQLIAERAAMAQAGAVFATVEVDGRGMLVGTPQVETRGVYDDDSPEVAAEAVRLAIDEALRSARGPHDVLEPTAAREAAQRALRRVYRVGHKRPLVSVSIRRAVARG